MYFTEIELHNYGIYKGTHTITLRNGLDNRNITLIGGMNGRGKTTLHDSVILALYGRIAIDYFQEAAENGRRSYERFLSEHINKYTPNGDNTYIKLTLMLEDEEDTNLVIVRSWKNGSVINDQVEVYKNGIQDKILAESWPYYIEEILPFNIAKFFFFNNEKISQLADDVAFEQIKGSIKSAIGISTIERACEDIEKIQEQKEKELKHFQNSELNHEYQDINIKISEVNKRLADCQEKIDKQEPELSNLESMLKIREKEFWNHGGKIGLNRKEIKAEMESIEAAINESQGKIMSLVSDPAVPLLMCRTLLKSTYDEASAAQANSTNKIINDRVLSVCNELKQKIHQIEMDENLKEKIFKVVDEESSKFDASVSAISADTLSATSFMLLEKLITDLSSSVPQKIRELVDEIDRQESRMLSLDNHLSSSTAGEDDAMGLYNEIKQIQNTLVQISASLDNAKKQKDSFCAQKEVLTNKRNSIIVDWLSREDANDDNKRIAQYCAMSSTVLKRFMQEIQKEKLGRLGEAVTECFKALVQKNSLVSQIAIDSNTIDIRLYDDEGQELLKQQMSAGEQQMFAVAVVWALAKSSGYKAPVWIDTPMARLDSNHRTNFVKKYIPNASSQVIVLSTDEELVGRYLEMVEDRVLDRYLLNYDDTEKCTTILPGYFSEVK